MTRRVEERKELREEAGVLDNSEKGVGGLERGDARRERCACRSSIRQRKEMRGLRLANKRRKENECRKYKQCGRMIIREMLVGVAAGGGGEEGRRGERGGGGGGRR